ncbi:MAG: hypothetical protein JWQ34_3407 [Mucilaginibacter sp.]|nr:hypothetical protein [Mucilaginibacter sp.]
MVLSIFKNTGCPLVLKRQKNMKDLAKRYLLMLAEISS